MASLAFHLVVSCITPLLGGHLQCCGIDAFTLKANSVVVLLYRNIDCFASSEWVKLRIVSRRAHL